ncbi:MAG TPA: rod shape-determining protein MreC [Casimicrobiaceae bacterium]|nr:rod shape-determining protein MreC [Casimicrobiaceae bacterium]
MRPIPVDSPAFFNRGPSPFARLVFFGLLSLVLLFTDTRYRYLEHVRGAVAVALYPLQRALLAPGLAIGYFARYIASKSDLADANAALEHELAVNAPAVQGYGNERRENAQLRELLALRKQYGGAAIAAQVLYTGRDPFSQKLYIDRGTSDGVEAGDGVIDDTGVVGQVTRVLPRLAEVTLITDREQAVPVKVERSGARSVMFGSGTGRAPELRFTAPSADLRAGDRLVTSGIDGTYPAGLAVAVVTEVAKSPGEMFARIACRPLAGVDRSEYLLVLARPRVASPPPQEDSAAAAPAKKGARARAPRG